MIKLLFFLLLTQIKLMSKIILLFSCLCLFSVAFSQKDSVEIKPRKLSFNDFLAYYSINDTSAAVIELFFDKKDNNAFTEMSLLPISAAVILLSPPIGIGLSAISVPLFVHGSILLIKYNKKKLKRILIEYKKSGYLPEKIRKKANKIIYYYSFPE